MSWFLLGFATLSLCGTLTLYLPRRTKNLPLRWMIFAFAFPTIELSWLFGTVQIITASLLVWGGALNSLSGRIGMAVFALSWLGLLLSFLRSFKTRKITEAALKQGLGDNYRDIIPTIRRDILEDRISALNWLRPYRFSHKGVEKLTNIPYAHGGVRRMMDIYRPTTLKPEGHPVLLQIHGGAFVLGRKDDQALPLMNYLAQKGWICVAVNYRLSPSVAFPTHLQDIKAAIGWIRTHGRDYGMNPDFIAVTGGSAGGHLTALTGLTPNRPELQPDYPDVDTRVQACVPFYGAYDINHGDDTPKHVREQMAAFEGFSVNYLFHATYENAPDLWDLASPRKQINSEAPPFFMMHGTIDSILPYEDARAFAKHLRNTSKHPVVYAELPGAEHAFDVFHSPRAEYAIRAAHRFLEWALVRHQV